MWRLKKKFSILFVTVRELDGSRSDAPVSVVLCVCELLEKASHARGMGPTYPPVQTVLHDPLKETVSRDLCPFLICFISSLEYSKNAGSYRGPSFISATHSDILSKSSCHCPFNLSLVSNPFEAVLYSFNDVSVVPQQLSTNERRPQGRCYPPMRGDHQGRCYPPFLFGLERGSADDVRVMMWALNI